MEKKAFYQVRINCLASQTTLATGDEDRGGSVNLLRELMTRVGGRMPPYLVNFQEPLASPVVSWEILREDGPAYQSMQIRFYDT